MSRESDQKFFKSARLKAREVLIKIGFVEENDHVFLGKLDVEGRSSIDVQIKLLHDFPVSLPEIKVLNPEQISPRIPHLEEDDKVCIGHSEGTLLDMSRPDIIVNQALKMASKTIQNGLRRQNKGDFADEFLAYWKKDLFIASIFEAQGGARAISFLKPSRKEVLPRGHSQLIAENKSEVIEWIGDSQIRVNICCDAFYLPLEKPLRLALEEDLPVQEIFSILEGSAPAENQRIFKDWRKSSKLPFLTVISFPAESGGSKVLFGILFPKPPTRELNKQATKGFRSIKVTASHQLRFLSCEKVQKVKLDRYDSSYLLKRGGVVEELFNKKVVLVGCGSVGSRIAEKLASSGIGHFCFVDHDIYDNDNLHRHILPMRYIGKNKAKAMGQYLREKFPHIKFEFHDQRILDLMEKEEGVFENFDLISMATGNETLEIYLNQRFSSTVPCVFSCLEALGIGQHVFSSGLNGGGCLECLCRIKGETGPNRAFFAVPNQSLRKNHAGCGGTYLPFSSLDADRTALEAASLIINILLGRETKNTRASFKGDTTAFLGAGFKLSDNAGEYCPGE